MAQTTGQYKIFTGSVSYNYCTEYEYILINSLIRFLGI